MSNHTEKKTHTVRNVLLSVFVVFALLFVGCSVLVGTTVNEIDKSIEADTKEKGGTENPVEISEGKEFNVRGFEYSGGWKLADDYGTATVNGLKVTNNRKDKDSALVEIKVWKGTEVLALVDCTTEPVAVGTTTGVDCFGADPLPEQYDKITINDSF